MSNVSTLLHIGRTGGSHVFTSLNWGAAKYQYYPCIAWYCCPSKPDRGLYGFIAQGTGNFFLIHGVSVPCPTYSTTALSPSARGCISPNEHAPFTPKDIYPSLRAVFRCFSDDRICLSWYALVWKSDVWSVKVILGFLDSN